METMELLKEVLTGVEKTLDSDSVIGKPITNDLITVIPVSKMTVGFGSGGGELESKKAIKKSEIPIGAVGGGASIFPMGFLVIDGYEVKFIKTDTGDKWNEYIEKIMSVLSR